MIRLAPFILMLSSALYSFGQYTLKGTLTAHPNTEIRLKGFNGFDQKILSNDTTGQDGSFELNYPENYVGMGELEVKGGGSLLFILSGENRLEVRVESIQNYNSLKTFNSPDNGYFDSHILQKENRNKKLDGWKWLKPIYEAEDSLSNVLADINKEIKRLEKEEIDFLNSIPNTQYASF